MNPLSLLFMDREAGAGRGLVVPPLRPVEYQGPGAKLRAPVRRAPGAAPSVPMPQPGLYGENTHEGNMAALQAAMAQDAAQQPPGIPDADPRVGSTHEANMAALEAAMRSPQMSPVAPAQDPGILAQVRNFMQGVDGRKDKDAIYNGMVQAGVGLLGSGGNVAKGLAEGFGGFNEGYGKTLDAQKAANTPKLTPLANGAFTMVQFPDGRQQVLPNSEVQRYMESLEGNKLAREVFLQGVKRQGEIDVKQAGQDIKGAADARGSLQTAQGTLEKFNKALEVAARQGTTAQIASLPGISGVAEFFGTESAKDNLLFKDISVDETLLRTAQTKGAITEKEMALFKSPIPGVSADREKVWKPWLEERRAILQNKIIPFLEAEAARGTQSPQAPSAPAAPGGRYSGQVPGLSPAAAKYLN